MDGEPVTVWLRCEDRADEQRAPLVPDDARGLVEHGVAVVVEDSARRVFPVAEYADAGCRVVEAGSWVDAPPQVFVLGIKELPPGPPGLRHRHIFFGHAYKGQRGARDLLHRFVAGGGALLDLEYLVDGDGRRLAAFGYWAGYVGAALAALLARGRLEVPLRPMTRAELDAALTALSEPGEPGVPRGSMRALVIGAQGRSGRGAVDALRLAGMPVTGWDLAETAALDRPALLAHDVLVNTVLATSPGPAFVRAVDVADRHRRLSVICDVTCDVGSELNVLPIYHDVTSWTAPVRRLHEAPLLELIAIDNLPSLLPREASAYFSSALAPHLAGLGGLDTDGPWRQCLAEFTEAVRRAT